MKHLVSSFPWLPSSSICDKARWISSVSHEPLKNRWILEEEREEEGGGKKAHGRLNSLEGGGQGGSMEWRHKTREGTPDEPNKKRFRAQSRFRFARHRLGIDVGEGIDNSDADIYHRFAARANEDNGWNGETKDEIHLDPRERLLQAENTRMKNCLKKQFVYYYYCILFYNKYEIKFKRNAIVVRSSKDEKRNARPNYWADKPNPVSTPRFPPTTPKLRSRLIHRREPLLDPLDPLYECGASSAKDHHVLRPIPYYTPWSLSPENLIPVSSYYNSLEILAK